MAPEPAYAHGPDYDLNRYIDYAHAQIEELLTRYGPIAGIWLDGVAVPLSGDRSRFRCQELYDKIHRLQPHALVSFKHGVTGTEDFYAPEHSQLKHVPWKKSSPQIRFRTTRRCSSSRTTPGSRLTLKHRQQPYLDCPPSHMRWAFTKDWLKKKNSQ